MVANQVSLAVAGRSRGESTERRSRWETGALACGIAFVILLFTSLFIGPAPLEGDVSAAQVVDTYLKHGDASLMQAYVRGVTALLMFVFVTGMVSVTRRSEGRVSLPSLLALGSALAFALVMFISNMADATAVAIARQGAQAETVFAMHALGDMMRHLNSLPYALLLGTVSAALLRARAVPRIVGWAGLACVPLFLAAAAGFPTTRLETINLAALPFLPLLTLLQSITLLARSRGDGRESFG